MAIYLKACHSATSGHFSIIKTKQRTAEQFYWKGLDNDVRELVSSYSHALCSNIRTIQNILITMYHSIELRLVHTRVAMRVLSGSACSCRMRIGFDAHLQTISGVSFDVH